MHALTMDRARRAEPYSNATIWTREIARNLAGHLARISKAHSYVDTGASKTRVLPKVHPKRCATSPMKARHHPSEAITSAARVDEVKDAEAPEERDDDGDDGDGGQRLVATSPHGARHEDLEDGHADVHVSRRQVQHKTPKKKARPNGPKKSKMEADRLEAIAHENQRLQVRLAKIATPHEKHIRSPALDSGPHSAEISVMRDHLEQSKAAHDYNKKQEQLKIWTENQALVKRLRTAKTTLNSKEWEKDDRWNQNFLRSQEKRRTALQQELLRAQMSPHAVLARGGKLSELHDARRPSNMDASCPSTRTPGRRMNHKLDSIEKESDSESGCSSRATAANHRRIMMLRDQRSAPPPERHCAATQSLGNQFERESPFESDNDVVSTRFTFSRERGKGNLCSDENDRDLGSVLTIDTTTCFASEHPSDNAYALGAFSPATELESALDAIEMDADPATALDNQPAVDADEVIETLEALEESNVFTDEEINAVVFETLQDSIDHVADEFLDDGIDSSSVVATETCVNQSGERHLTADGTPDRAEAEGAQDPGVDAPVAAVEEDDLTAAPAFSTQDAIDNQAGEDSSPRQLGQDTDENVSLAVMECERIPCDEGAGIDPDPQAQDRSDTDTTVTGDGTIKDGMQDPSVTDTPEEAGESETSRDAGEPHEEPEYGEEHFDLEDAAAAAEVETPAAPAAVTDTVHESEKSEIEGGHADDEESGYGSEFDDEQDHVEHVDPTMPNASATASVDYGNDDDEGYEDDHDLDPESQEAEEGAPNASTTQHHQLDDASYSDDDDFSDT